MPILLITPVLYGPLACIRRQRRRLDADLGLDTNNYTPTTNQSAAARHRVRVSRIEAQHFVYNSIAVPRPSATSIAVSADVSHKVTEVYERKPTLPSTFPNAHRHMHGLGMRLGTLCAVPICCQLRDL
ncbi:hypothetical protein IWX47DRAFT_843410 [Phyllosticta citricarpa]